MTRPDPFEQRRTCETLADFARKLRRMPYAIYRGVHYHPLFYGPSETPAYRRFKGNSSDWRTGEIVTTWPDGRVFRSQSERDEACVQDAASDAQDDLTRAEALAWVRASSQRASRGLSKRSRDRATAA